MLSFCDWPISFDLEETSKPQAAKATTEGSRLLPLNIAYGRGQTVDRASEQRGSALPGHLGRCPFSIVV